MESALYGIFTLVGFVSEISLPFMHLKFVLDSELRTICKEMHISILNFRTI